MDFEVLRVALLAETPERLQEAAMAQFARDHHPADIARFLEEQAHENDLDAKLLWAVLERVPVEPRAEVFQHLSPSLQVRLADAINRRSLAELMTHMSADDRAHLFKHLSSEQQASLLPGFAQAEREDIRRLASYEEGTAGSIMTSEYAVLTPELTAREAIERLRAEAPDKETIYEAYVVDAQRRLVGSVSLQKLMIALSHKRVASLMRTEPVFAHVDDDRSEAARKIGEYDLIALPIVNGEHKLVGIVTHDDALDIVEQDATEAFHRVGTVGPLEGSVLGVKLRVLYQKRVGWLVLLVFANLFSGAGIAAFEATLSAHMALMFFLPLLIASAGNAGSQSATLMIRALAVGDVHLRDWGGLLGRELAISVALGATTALAVTPLGIWRGGPEIALVVASTMILVVMLGCVIGMSLPFVLNRFKLDPATASTPLVTVICDVVGVVTYLGIATSVLSMPVGS